MINWADFHFLRPWWLLALPLALGLIFLLRKQGQQKTSWDRVIDPHLLPYLFRKPARDTRMHSWWSCAFVLLAIIALAGPTHKKMPNEAAFYKPPVVICLEVSPHMLSKDVNPSRFKRALFKLEDLLRLYQGAEVALIAFAGDAHLVVPLSNDYNTVLTMAKVLSPDLMPVKGVNLKNAVKLAQEITNKTPRAQIVVMTSSNFDDNALGIKELSKPLFVWAFATEAGGPLERSDGRFDQGRAGQVTISKLRRDYLSKLADFPLVKTMTFTPDQQDVATIVSNLSTDSPVRSSREELFDQWYDLGPYVLAAAMVMFLASVFLSRKQAIVLSLLVMLPSAQGKAFNFADLFLRRDQQGQRALDENNPQRAADLFEDDFRKGSAFYRAKNYDEAIKHLSSVNTSDGQFNLGNAFAQKGQYQEAIAAYEKALTLNPQNSDAKANKDLLEKSQQQQQEKKESDQGEKSDKEQDSSPSEQKSDENKDGQKENEPSSQNKKEDEQKPAHSQDQQKSEQKANEGQGQKPKEEQQGQAKKKEDQVNESKESEKLDPETRYHFQRLEQKNNSLFLKRKFLYESQKRQVEQ